MRDRSDWIDGVTLRKTVSWPVVTRLLCFAVIKGRILNTINQGDAILNGGAINRASWPNVAI